MESMFQYLGEKIGILPNKTANLPITPKEGDKDVINNETKYELGKRKNRYPPSNPKSTGSGSLPAKVQKIAAENTKDLMCLNTSSFSQASQPLAMTLATVNVVKENSTKKTVGILNQKINDQNRDITQLHLKNKSLEQDKIKVESLDAQLEKTKESNSNLVTHAADQQESLELLASIGTSEIGLILAAKNLFSISPHCRYCKESLLFESSFRHSIAPGGVYCDTHFHKDCLKIVLSSDERECPECKQKLYWMKKNSGVIFRSTQECTAEMVLVTKSTRQIEHEATALAALASVPESVKSTLFSKEDLPIEVTLRKQLPELKKQCVSTLGLYSC